MNPAKELQSTSTCVEPPNTEKEGSHLKASAERFTSLQNRKVVILVRTAERVDRVFPEWIRNNFTDNGEYYPDDLNLPALMFKRPEGPRGYADDPPITEIGSLNAEMIGKSIRRNNVWPLAKIYCSPALRCVQTANSIVKGIGRPIEICVEPALFDWGYWYKNMPWLLSIEEHFRCGSMVSNKYKPITTVNEIAKCVGSETIEDFYSRVRAAVERITMTPSADRILIVAHATVLDAAVKGLQRCSPRLIEEKDMLHIGTQYPYACSVTLAQSSTNWNFVHDVISEMSYLGISNRINAKFVNRTTKTKDLPLKKPEEKKEAKEAKKPEKKKEAKEAKKPEEKKVAKDAKKPEEKKEAKEAKKPEEKKVAKDAKKPTKLA
uniref:Protein UBASH3A-like protein n=1 Tax=Steinernema glaseri TaxID=37863 RepID=A0A1I7ZY35_9BILA